jgi:cytochrome P450
MPSADYSVQQTTVEAFLNNIVLQLYSKANRTAGEQFTVPVFADADSIYRIVNQPAQFPKIRNMGLIGALGDSRLTANGQDWEVRRSITHTSYLQAGSSQNASTISAIYTERFSGCEATPEGILRALMLASSDIFFRALGCEADTGRLLVFFDRARHYIKRLQYYSWNAPSASDASTLRSEGSDLLHAFSQEVSTSPAMTGLIEAFQNRVCDLQDFNPLDELLMNFFAGIETTAATLSFAIDRLGIDSRVQNRLHDEVEQGFEKTIYLDCFIQETMRYFPTIPFVIREAATDTILNDISLAKGDKILLSIVGLHHNRLYWNEPEIFDCSRSEFLGNSYNRRAFLPFSAGPRMCGGAKLAALELTEGLKAFVRQFTVDGSADEIGFDYGIALRPKSQTGIRILHRQ